MTYVIKLDTTIDDNDEKVSVREVIASELGGIIDPEKDGTRFISNDYEKALEIIEKLIAREEVRKATLTYCK
jgi:hypothetical protein